MKFKKVFQLLIEFFERERIDYALIGAFALKAYGYVRATQDVDFIVRQKNQKKIIANLESLGFETIYSSKGYSNHIHHLSDLCRIDFVYVKGDTAETIFNETAKLLVLGNLTLPVVKPEHIVALKVFAMKNDPERALREMADIKELLNLPEINLQKVQKYFEKYGQMERYYDIIGEKQKK
ncbi:MAG: nucleotidyltransferase family protein [Deltaproteobacteria bacterium]|nr:nucleotidyltransferase family protein [Deltaproteobacteria bacterium]